MSKKHLRTENNTSLLFLQLSKTMPKLLKPTRVILTNLSRKFQTPKKLWKYNPYTGKILRTVSQEREYNMLR
jgi:hypothetical protein